LASLKRILADFKVFRRQYLRSWEGVFFALLFPVIIILLFGAIFSGGGSGSINLYVQNHDAGYLGTNAGTTFVNALNSTKTIHVVLVSNSQNLSQYLSAHSYTEGLVIPQNFSQAYLNKQNVNITLITDPADSSSGIVQGFVSEVVNYFNLHQPGSNLNAVIGASQETVSSKSFSYIDFLIPGLIGFTILTSPMFSMVNLSAEYKKNKIFKQLSLTPLTKGEWLASKIIWYVILSIISFILLTIVGVVAFGAHVIITPWIIPFLIIGPLFFVALGMLVGTVTKSQESAGVIGNVITFPMMFLSGTFFPVSTMPSWLQKIVPVLPLYYVIDGLNAVMVFSNYSKTLYDTLILSIISAIVFALAVKFFKWRED
jgi:ABC-2 type transport system permease protein